MSQDEKYGDNELKKQAIRKELINIIDEADREMRQLVEILFAVFNQHDDKKCTQEMKDFFAPVGLDAKEIFNLLKKLHTPLVGKNDRVNKDRLEAKYSKIPFEKLKEVTQKLDEYQQAHKTDTKFGYLQITLEALTLLLGIVTVIPFLYKTYQEYESPKEEGIKETLQATGKAMYKAGHSFFESGEVHTLKDAAREIQALHVKCTRIMEKAQGKGIHIEPDILYESKTIG